MADPLPTPLFSAETLATRVDSLAAEIAARAPAELTLVALLKGSFVFAADLVRRLHVHGVRVRVEFLRLKSYGSGTLSSGRVQQEGEVPGDLAGRAVLVVDDITDAGRTLLHARTLLEQQAPRSLWTCTLLDKPSRREVDIEPDFTGFRIEDHFVVGYGLDHAGDWRELPYVGVLSGTS